MKYIGKANKYYTLWEVYNATRSDYLGHPYEVTVHEYIKNMSYSLDTAKSQYPDAPVDESLRGTSSWETPVDAPSSNPVTDPTVFPKGKYAGTKIAECTDLEYLHWAQDNILTGESAEIAERVLTDNGWKRLNECAIVSPDVAKNIDTTNDMLSGVISRIDRGERVEFTTNYNPDSEGRVVDPTTRITFVFPEVSMFYYAGHEYFLPTVNGKAKRVKGKTIDAEVDRYELDTDTYGWEHDLKVYIKSFKVK